MNKMSVDLDLIEYKRQMREDYFIRNPDQRDFYKNSTMTVTLGEPLTIDARDFPEHFETFETWETR